MAVTASSIVAAVTAAALARARRPIRETLRLAQVHPESSRIVHERVFAQGLGAGEVWRTLDDGRA